MNKLKQPVIVDIDGTSFEVDIDRQVLRQTGDQANEISFIRDMQDMDMYYRFLYNRETKRPVTEYVGRDTVHPINMPQMIALDPEGMAQKYGVPVDQLKGKNDFTVIVDQEALQQRQKGVLPQIDIAGERFVVDIRLQELRHAAHFFPVISLKSFELTANENHYQAYYHPVMKQTVELDPKLLEFPDHVIKIKLPNELGLDPVAAAAIYGMDEREVLRRYPIQKGLKAELIPLSETNVPTLIRQNREKLQQEHAETTRQIRPKHRHKF